MRRVPQDGSPAGGRRTGKGIPGGAAGRAYHDTALDYLDAVQDRQYVPAQVRVVLGYERGVTLIEAAKGQHDLALREGQLEQAQAALSEFVAQLPTHELVGSAKLQQGNLLVERARLKLQRAGQSTALDQTKLKSEARQLYAQAHAHFQGISAMLRTALEAFPKAT